MKGKNPRRHGGAGHAVLASTGRGPSFGKEALAHIPAGPSCLRLLAPHTPLPQRPALSLRSYLSEGSSSAELVASSPSRSPPHLQGCTAPSATSRVALRSPGAVSGTPGVCSSPDSQPHASPVPQLTWPHTPARLGPLLRMSPRFSVPKKLASNQC